ncbi:MAG: transposase [Betaproteobacteria bacterium]|nr:transposase [Betaproteobacteria bacterium]
MMPLPAATEPFYPKGGGLGTLLTGLVRRFLGMNLAGESAPDATTLLKFRRRLEDNKLTASRHLGAHHTRIAF